jgi:hypothetical protein
MSDLKNPFDLLLDQFRLIVREEVQKALANRQPAKMQFTLDEAAHALNIKPSLLGSRVRAGEFPHHRDGHRIFFTQQDLDEIVVRSAITPKNGKD